MNAPKTSYSLGSQADYFLHSSKSIQGTFFDFSQEFIDDYRYGFNGMEKDDEVSGSGNSYTTQFRLYDPRVARWLSTDPVTHAHFSPYSAFDNSPILIMDPSGADGEDPKYKSVSGIDGETYNIPEEKNVNAKFFEVASIPLNNTSNGDATDYAASVPIGAVKSFYGDDGQQYKPHWGVDSEKNVYFKGYLDDQGVAYVNPSSENSDLLAEGEVPIVTDYFYEQQSKLCGEIKLASYPETLYKNSTIKIEIDNSSSVGIGSLVPGFSWSNILNGQELSGSIFLEDYNQNPADVINNSRVSVTYSGVGAGYFYEFNSGVFSIVGYDDLNRITFYLSDIILKFGVSTKNPIPVDHDFDNDAPTSADIINPPTKADSTRMN